MLLKRWKRLFYSLLHYFRHIFHGLLLLKVWRVRTTQLFGDSSSLWNTCFSLKRFLWTQWCSRPIKLVFIKKWMSGVLSTASSSTFDSHSVSFVALVCRLNLFCQFLIFMDWTISSNHGIMNYFLKPWYNELSQHKNQAIAFSSNVVFFFQVLQKENKIQNNKRYSFKVYTEVE